MAGAGTRSRRVAGLESTPARACSASRAVRRAATASSRSRLKPAVLPTSAPRTSNGAPGDAGSCRSRVPPSCRRICPVSMTGAPGAPISAATGPTAPTHRCDWSGAATGSGARSAIGNGATFEAARRASMRRARSPPVCSCRIRCPRTGLAEAWRSGHQCQRGSSFGSAPMADRRPEKRASWPILSPVNRPGVAAPAAKPGPAGLLRKLPRIWGRRR